MALNNQNALDVFRTPCLRAHVLALVKDATAYIAGINFLIDSGTFPAVPSSVRTSMLVALHTTAQSKALTRLLQHCEVTDILKALTMLDDRRLSRQLARKIQRIENECPHLICLSEDESTTEDDGSRKRKTRRKVDLYRRKLRSIDDNLAKSCADKTCCVSDVHSNTAVLETIQSAPGLSGALAQKVRAWAKSTLTQDGLEFIMLTDSKSPWRTLADLVHFRPSDFAVSYFLADVHDESIPETCFVARLRAMVAKYSDDSVNKDEVLSDFLLLAAEFPQLYLAFDFFAYIHSL